MKNLAKVGDIKYVFLYPLPDSSLFITICFLIFHFFMYECPPLKNDGTSELRFEVVLNDFFAKKKRI